MKTPNGFVDSQPNAVAVVTSKWTQRDEAMLLDLMERKTRIMTEKRAAVVAVVGDHNPAMADFVIEHADALTRVLAPFCSDAT